MASRVSVVVPTFNNASTIGDTLESIFAQTFDDLEVIIADHSSTDGTWDVLQRYRDDPRVTLLQTEAGGSALRNWNRVSQAASGEYLKLVCGDDLIYPDLIGRQVAALDEHRGATLSASARDIIDVNDRPVIRGRGLGGFTGAVAGHRAVRRTVVKGTNIFGEPACVMVRRSALEATGWWDAEFPYLIDQATFMRVLLEGDFVAVPESLAAFRMSDSQWSVRLAEAQATQAIGLHQRLRREHPEIVSAFDLWRGNVAARLTALSRRAAYVVFRSRMRSTEQ